MEKDKDTSQPYTGKIWSGVYNSFDEASNSSEISNEDNIWNDPAWIDRQFEQLAESNRKLGTGKGISELAETKDYLLPAVFATLVSDNCLRILDFGGGMGNTYLTVKAMIPAGIDYEYIIVENEIICDKGEVFFKNDKRVRFVTQIPTDQQFDVIHLGSSMHYINDWRGLIATFANMKPSYLIFADLPAGNIHTFVTNQTYAGKFLPVRFWNIDEFISEVTERGFTLVLKARLFSKYIDAMRFFDSKHKLEYFSQLIFKLGTDTVKNV